MDWFIIGISAAMLTTFGFVPQIIRMIRTKSVQDVSLMMLFQFCVGVFLWVLYGIHLKDVIIIAANIISFMTLILSLGLYFYYERKSRV